MFIQFNPNPFKILVGDCVIRAISKIVGKDWEEIYSDLSEQGYRMKDMPSANRVWGQYLKNLGFERKVIPDSCPDCYTVKRFCEDHPYGKYILATGTHVVAVAYGNYYDSWDSGQEVPIFYYERG